MASVHLFKELESYLTEIESYVIVMTISKRVSTTEVNSLMGCLAPSVIHLIDAWECSNVVAVNNCEQVGEFVLDPTH